MKNRLDSFFFSNSVEMLLVPAITNRIDEYQEEQQFSTCWTFKSTILTFYIKNI
jgi:hypothetical protein